jgi:hypothetical protein
MLKLKWYEWIGWSVNLLMITMATLFIALSYLDEEMRAAVIAAIISIFFIGAWTWVLLFYGKTQGVSNDAESSISREEKSGK